MDLDSKRTLRRTVVTVATTALLTGGAATAATADRENPPITEPDSRAEPQQHSTPQSGPDARPRPVPPGVSPAGSPDVSPAVPPAGAGAAPQAGRPPRAEPWHGSWHVPDSAPGHLPGDSGPQRPEQSGPQGPRVEQSGPEGPRAAESGPHEAEATESGPHEAEAAESGPRSPAEGPEPAYWPEVGAPGAGAWHEFATPHRSPTRHRPVRTHDSAHVRKRAKKARAHSAAVRQARRLERARFRGGNHAVKSFAFQLVVTKRSWGPAQFRCLDRLWTRESNWNHRARNPRSGAYGIPQALPAAKMRVSGHDWRSNPKTQVRWGLRYIKSRYGTPCAAWAHFRSHNWY